ncbi:MAG: hypothetical protein JXA61_09410 [Bacteroidales bacterium]|nr:hypothetical protein [Bacteroidales bacterium]
MKYRFFTDPVNRESIIADHKTTSRMNRYSHDRLQIIFALTFCFMQADLLCTASAQELDKEVYVIRPYEPVISDANKISILPEIEDITTSPPEFSYRISSQRIPSSIELNRINPARMVAVSLPKIYNSWIKLGLGNYTTPLAEFNISNLHSRNGSLGAYLYHKSSHSNLRLPNNDRVPAGYARNKVNLYGRRTYSKAVLSGNLLLEHNSFRYYGYNTTLFSTEPLPDMKQDSIRQQTWLLGFDAGIASSYAGTSFLNYDIKAGFDYFFDENSNYEAIAAAEAGVNKYFGELQGGIDLGVDYFHLRGEGDTVSNAIVRVNPWISKNSEDWRFILGFQAVADIDDISRFYFYPAARLEITVVKNVLVPFLGLSGTLNAGNYQQLTRENPFVRTGLRLKNTNNSLIAYGGVKGSISNAVRFRFDVTYSVNKNMHFFINDTLIPLQNQFTGEYDDVDIIVYHGQLAFQPAASLGFTMDGHYYDYHMMNLRKPWHKPEYELNINVLYNIKNKVSLNGEMILLGTRWIRNELWTDGIQKLKPLADFNLKINYHHSKTLTLFFDLYNISNRSHLIWNQFPSQRFNFLAGLSFKL